MSSTKKLLTRFLPKDRIKINEPLALHTYIKLGGPADFFTVVKSADELAGAVMEAEKLGVPWFILGGGSNILVGDLGFRGLVIKNEAKKLTVNGERLAAESGVLMSKLAAFANQKGLSGLEMFMSVPGTLGGAIYNNSHYRPDRGEFIGNLVESADLVRVLSRSTPLRRPRPYADRLRALERGPFASHPLSQNRVFRTTVGGDWFRFGYDYSRLQEEKAVVLRVKLKLKRGDPEELREKSLELMKQRNRHQPIGRSSCGCMFKNPNGMSARLPARQAGKLIDEAGVKGTRVGGISVSQTHANFMVNDGTGKVGDVLELMARVKKRVKEKFGIELEPEIFFVGEFGSKNKLLIANC